MMMNTVFQMQGKRSDPTKKSEPKKKKEMPMPMPKPMPKQDNVVIKPLFNKVPTPAGAFPLVPVPVQVPVKPMTQDTFNKNLNEVRIKHSGPLRSDKKFLVVIATHTDSEIKRSSIRDNIIYLRQNNNLEFAVINSSDIDGNEEMKDYYEYNDIEYYEIPNDKAYDFGKWYHVLKEKMLSLKDYDYVVLTNDSYVLSSSLSYFFNLCIEKDVEIYGYNDSDEDKYHYQSYLFALKSSAVSIFCSFVESKLKTLKNQVDVINQCELKLLDKFNTYDCFLKISECPKNNKKNVFFKNDSLYSQLKACGLLPFTKIKRILAW